jgi:glycosyltransferase involved in cell wall biosynthesis
MAAPTPAFYFEPDGYQLGAPMLMGRQVASHGFLRAAVAAAGGEPVTGYGPEPLGPAFEAVIRTIDPAASSAWIPQVHLERLVRQGLAHRPDPQIGFEARQRLRVGAGAYGLTGVVHTTATALDSFARLVGEPLTPWDALICPTRSAAKSLENVFDEAGAYYGWRFGPDARIAAPRLAPIPLAVHWADFQFGEAERAASRQALGIAPNEVVALFVGRLSMMTKAHPLAMYLGLQAAAERTGKPVVLVQCGWATSAPVGKAMEAGAADFCPSVRSLFVDGRTTESSRRCWAAADLFVSLSDNVQETFGLTPVEAMAAGLPVVVSDWDGYRETVRDGVDGFRIATRAPEGGTGVDLARAFESGTLTMDLACWAAAASTAVDVADAAERLTALVADADLRRRLGESGRAHARECFDWPVVYAAHLALWAELDARRRAATSDELAWLAAAPRSALGFSDLFAVFDHYPTALIGETTTAALAAGATLARYQAVARHALFPMDPAAERFALPLWQALEAGPRTLADLAQATGLPPRRVVLTAGTLAKMGLIDLS